MKRTYTVIGILSVLMFGKAAAEPPVGKIPYQGRLTDTNENPLSGTYNLTFNICDSAAGDCTAAPGQLWTETQAGVSVDRGIVTVNLGDVTPIPGSIFASAATYLEIQVGADPAMTPRTRLLPSPYAFNSQTLQGYDLSAFVSTFSAQAVAGIKIYSNPVTFIATSSFINLVGIASATVYGTILSTSGFVGVGSTLTALNASNLALGTVPNTRIDSSSIAKWNALGLIDNARLDPGVVTNYTSPTFTSPVTFNSTSTFMDAVTVSSITSVGTITSTNGVVGANMVYLISADEVNSSTATTTTAEQNLKSYTLAPNDYQTIMMEAEVSAWNYQDLASVFVAHWMFYEAGTIRKDFLWNVVGTAAGTAALPQSQRMTGTLKTSFPGGQGVNTSLSVRGRMSASNALDGIIVHSLRVYGVK